MRRTFKGVEVTSQELGNGQIFLRVKLTLTHLIAKGEAEEALESKPPAWRSGLPRKEPALSAAPFPQGWA